MASTLFHIPAEFAGMPVFGFGLLMGVWLVASVAFLAWLAWRQGFNADTLGYIPVLLLIGAVIGWLLPVLSKEQGLPIRGYGVMMFLAVVAGTAMTVHRAKRIGIVPDTIFSLAFWMVLPGILGARAFYVIEYWQPDFWPHYTSPDGGLGPLLASLLRIDEGGLVVYGSFFGAVAGMLFFVYKHRLPLLALCDVLAPSMALGLAIGRIGCLLNGCCYGAVCHHGWAVTFPQGSPAYRSQATRGQMYGFTLPTNPKADPVVQAVEPDSPANLANLERGDFLKAIFLKDVDKFEIVNTEDAYWVIEQAFAFRKPLKIELAKGGTIEIPAVPIPPRSLAVHPTQIYSTIDGLVLCLLLLAYAPFARRDGEVFALMISIYPITRFLIEGLRTDEAAIGDTGMSISQNVSIGLLLAAIALWVYISRQPKRRAESVIGRAKASTKPQSAAK